MKKLIKFLFILIIVLVALGYGAYYFGANLASEKLMDVVSTELENSGQIEEVKQYVESNPEIKQFLAEAETVDHGQLPFTTKEEATKVLIKRVGIPELLAIQTKVQEGTMSKEELLQKVQENFTEEEITAFKVVAYKELYKQAPSKY